LSYSSEKTYQIYYSLLGMLLSLALIIFVNDYYTLKVHKLVCLLYCLVSVLVIYLFDRYRKSPISYIVLLSLIPVVGLVFIFTRTSPITWVKGIVLWVIRYDQTEGLYELGPAYIVLFVVSIVSCILLYLLIKRLLTRLLLGLVIISLLVVFAVVDIHIGKLIVGISIFYMLSIFIELGGILYSRKNGKEDKREGILYLLPLCVLLAVIAVGIPSKEEPIQWDGIKTIYNNLKNQIEKLTVNWEFRKGDGDFSISLIGYSDDGSLDNRDLENSQRIALIVKGRRGLSPMYLIGSVRDTYTGYSWEKSGEDFLKKEEEYQMDYGELFYNLSRLEPSFLEDNRLVESKTVKIIYNNIKTRTFFHPQKFYWFQTDNPANIDRESASISFLNPAGNNMAYNISYYEMNLEGDGFVEMLRGADEFSYNTNINLDYERIEQLEKKYYIRDKENFILRRQDFHEIFRDRAAIINNKYTQLPQDLPSQVKDLAYEITKEQETKYDKLKAIEAYLLEYTYSYNPGKPPEGMDFTYYFLFENKQGYCTSFASAMAVLGRAIGIPTRYVEGFVVDYRDFDNRGFLVRNSMAHAWVEAYFEGIGWIPFEATPGYHGNRYTAWPAPKKSEGSGYYSSYYNKEKTNPYMEDQMDNSDLLSYEKLEAHKVLMWVLLIPAIFVFLLALVVLYYLVLRHKYKKEYEDTDDSGRMYLTFIRILSLLKKEGFKLTAHDTLIVFSDKIKDRFQYKGILFRDVVKIYMAYRYGEVKINEKELDKVREFYNGMMESRKQENKALRLHMEEFLFLVKRKTITTTYQD